jgi:hypothetical protein
MVVHLAGVERPTNLDYSIKYGAENQQRDDRNDDHAQYPSIKPQGAV